MTTSLMGYTNRLNVENFLGQTYPAISNTEFNNYLNATERFIDNYLGYNAETTTSGILTEVITREKHVGKINAHGNLVVDVYKPPVNFDVNQNPLVTLLEFNLGGIRVTLQLTDGSNNPLNTLLEVDERRRKIFYPSLYFFPAISTVTPTAKVNLYNLRDVQFWIDVSYTGGYTILPTDIVQAANIVCGQMVLNRDNPNFAIMFKQGSYQVQYFESSGRYTKGQPVNKQLQQATFMLDPYKRITW